MDFVGEHLLPGKLGHFFILLSLVTSIAASVSYFFSVRNTDAVAKQGWRKLARVFFITECVSVFSIFAILTYIVFNHYFEYKFVWQHSSLSLETGYLLSCI